LVSVIQLIPDEVVNAVSSPKGVEFPARSATRKSALSAGGAACTQLIADCSDSPAPGAEIEPVFDGADVLVPAGPAGAATEFGVRVGVIGVSSVEPGLPAGIIEQPANSTEVIATRAKVDTIGAIRIRSGYPLPHPKTRRAK
jgi:hypothetical protein